MDFPQETLLFSTKIRKFIPTNVILYLLAEFHCGLKIMLYSLWKPKPSLVTSYALTGLFKVWKPLIGSTVGAFVDSDA